MSKQLTIVGRGESWRECLFQTDELWGTATCLLEDELKDKKFTKVFAFDDEGKHGIKESLTIAKERGISIVSTFPYATEQFPLVEIVKAFRSSYFKISISRMLAYAIYLDYTRLYVYGIDQGASWDYQAGKAPVLFWLGVATGKGIDLRVGRGSMKWAYRSGRDGLPIAFLLEDEERFAKHVGIAV